MAEIFEPTRNQTTPNNPRFCLRSKICRTISPSYDHMVLVVVNTMMTAPTGILAVFILATGERRPHYYKFLRQFGFHLATLLTIVFLLKKFARITIPEAYRQPQF